MRMRPHVDIARNARRKIHRPHVVEEDERPDHAALGKRQHAADLEPAETFHPAIDDDIEHLHLASPQRS